MEQGGIHQTNNPQAEQSFQRGRDLLNQGQFTEGERCLEQALQLSPDHLQAKVLLAHFCLVTHKTDRAESLISTLNQHRVPAVTRLNLTGQLHLQRNRAAEAKALFTESMALSPTDNAGVGLGIALIQLNQRDEAERLLRHVIASSQNCAEAYSALSECIMPGPYYRTVLSQMHSLVNPKTYLEIGVATGDSLQLASPKTRVIGVDPNPKFTFELEANTSVYCETSDVFFDEYDVLSLFGQKTIDFCFIDGLHTFDQALKDFINAEKYASEDAVFVFHDCYPFERTSASRERQTTFWAGDVWKVIPILEKYRPDLALHTIQAAPTGLGVVTGMNPQSSVLEEQFEAIVEEFMPMDFSYVEEHTAERLHLVKNDRATLESLLPLSDSLKMQSGN
ncbi:MAG: tetratricopeptide repeat protein [Myxococcota bacterium]|nr:tetratricopeptide repeat protein [Myxococcota bacterium]